MAAGRCVTFRRAWSGSARAPGATARLTEGRSCSAALGRSARYRRTSTAAVEGVSQPLSPRAHARDRVSREPDGRLGPHELSGPGAPAGPLVAALVELVVDPGHRPARPPRG